MTASPFVKELTLPREPVDAVVAFLAAQKEPFHKSELYTPVEGRKFVDPSSRESMYRAFSSDEALGLGEALVSALNKPDELNSYRLVRNNITHIRYTQGGFFAEHEDYLRCAFARLQFGQSEYLTTLTTLTYLHSSLTSNVVEECTALVCVNPAGTVTEGGDTRVKTGSSASVGVGVISSRAPVTPYGALLFRKDLAHEGLPITSGEKHVLSLNLWVMRRTSPVLLLVTFEDAAAAAEAAAPPPPLAAAADDKSYAIDAISLRKWPTVILNTVLDIAESPAAGGDSGGGTRLVTHVCTRFTFDAFETLYRAIHGHYVRPCDLTAHAEVLNYYGFPMHAVLVDIANAGNAGEPRAAAEMDGQVRSSQLYVQPAGAAAAPVAPPPPPRLARPALGLTDVDSEPPARAAQKRKSAPPPAADEEIIVCTSNERTRVVAAAAKTLGLPYIRFRAMFVEGKMTFSGDRYIPDDYQDGDFPGVKRSLKMQPVWVSLGDYDNVLAARWFHSSSSDVPHNPKLHEHPLFERLRAHQTAAAVAALATPGSLVCFVETDSEEKAEKEAAAAPAGVPVKVACKDLSRNNMTWAGLRFANCREDGPPTPVLDWSTSDIISSLLPADEYMTRDALFPRALMFPAAAAAEGPPPSPMFHIDARGASCFSPEEAEAASAHLARSGFVDELRRRIVGTALKLPQAKTFSSSASFCNEDVYGNFKVVELTGVVRLLPGGAPPPPN